MAEKKKILYIVEAMGGGVFTYIVDLANELVNKYDMYIAYTANRGDEAAVKAMIDEILRAKPDTKITIAINAVANKIPSLYSTAYGIFNLAWTETASKVSDDGNPAEYYTKLFSG